MQWGKFSPENIIIKQHPKPYFKVTETWEIMPKQENIRVYVIEHTEFLAENCVRSILYTQGVLGV